MATTLSAIDLPRHPNALEADNPLVRMAAVHHFGLRLGRGADTETAAARQRLATLLPLRAANGKWVNPPEFDELVSRYAAVTLARKGFREGLEFILDLLADRGNAPDPDLDECLRSCAVYPFAVLLNEQILLGSIPREQEIQDRQKRGQLSLQEMQLYTAIHSALRLTEVSFHKEAGDRTFRDWFLELLRNLAGSPGIKSRADRVIDRGVVLSAPVGKQAGYICCPGRGWFLQFNEEAVLNQKKLWTGQEALFVLPQNDPDGAAVCVFGLDDSAQISDAEMDQMVLRVALQEGRGTDSPLIPGVVTQLHRRRGKEPKAQILFANGTDMLTPLAGTDIKRVLHRTLVLVPSGEGGVEGRQLYVRSLILEQPRTSRVVSEYVKKLGLFPAKIREIDFAEGGDPSRTAQAVVMGPRGTLLRFPVTPTNQVSLDRSPPWPGHWLLLRPCDTCKGTSRQGCSECSGTRKVPCRGEVTCSTCRGRGNCSHCQSRGKLRCCEETGRARCASPTCKGTGKIPCTKCPSPTMLCSGCKGRKFTSGPVKCTRCFGHRRCDICGGSGLYNEITGEKCRTCRGSGDCRECRGDGTVWVKAACTMCKERGTVDSPTCTACNGQKLVACPRCKGTKLMACELCQGTKRRECAACSKDGTTPCQGVCAGAGWFLYRCVDVYLDPPAGAAAAQR